MKKIFISLFVLSFHYSLLTSLCEAQWQPDVRLTNNPSYSLSWYTKSIAASGNMVYTVWNDDRDGNFEIYYKRSTDAGMSWGADTRLTNNSGRSGDASVIVSGLIVHVVWNDDRDGNYEIYYKHSTDGGSSWGTDLRLTNDLAGSSSPSISLSGQAVHIVWHDNRDGNNEVYYKRSTDEGISWGADTRLTNDTAASQFPCVSVSGLHVSIVWDEHRDGNYEVYYKGSTDGGISWGADIRLTNNPANSLSPSLTVSGLLVHIVWQEERDGNAEIYYRRSTDGGSSWGSEIRLTNNTASSGVPTIAGSGMNLHIVWLDKRDGGTNQGMVYYKRSTDEGLSWGADTRLTYDLNFKQYPFVAVSGPVVHVVWMDQRDGNYEMYYKRDPAGNIVTGINNINPQTPNEFSLLQNYPNPFNPETKINFSVHTRSLVQLKVFDITGREVASLVNDVKDPGEYSFTFNGAGLSSGLYFYRLSAGEFMNVKKMILLK